MDKTFTPPKMCSVLGPSCAKIVGSSSTHQPLPMDQPTTPQALPFARTCSGKICHVVSKAHCHQASRIQERTSAGYNQGTVNHVAPKIAVYKYTKNTAAPPTCSLVAPVAFAVA